ncbi:MAG: L-threonylcarbamoyladenylate synthase [Clostridiales bacterium]|nr:L-threonylcarbamoyladenylate synthase [Clostridiales bacterium]
MGTGLGGEMLPQARLARQMAPLLRCAASPAIVPSIISAGLDTVAVRMPSHPVALELIRLSGVPVAAPSANSSGKPSPTGAEHVIEDLNGKVDIILDGGDVHVGLESTVLDITHNPPVILRPGGITPEMISSVIGHVEISPSLSADGTSASEIPRSPGMKYRHYAPKALMTVVSGPVDKMTAEIMRIALSDSRTGIKTAILATDETLASYKALAACEASAANNALPIEIISMGSRKAPETIAHSLFRLLRSLDGKGVGHILAEAIEPEGFGLAVMNRMLKAAGYNIINLE